MTVHLSMLDPVPVLPGQGAREAVRAAIRLAETAEQAGYLRVWYAEHHLPQAAACPAPAVLIGAAAAATTRLRVGAGGVALRHHAPWHVAETYATLGALYPQRIDLGIAGGLGAPDEVVARLGGGGTPLPDKLAELHTALTALEADVEPWLLGSSARSAAEAAQLGWGYGTGDVSGSPEPLQQYRAGYMRRGVAGPRVALAVAVVCAERVDTALTLASSHRAYFAAQGAAPLGAPVPPPDPAPVRAADVLRLYPRLVVGDPVTVRSALQALAQRYGADELVLLTVLHDQAARQRSYSLVAEAFRPAPAFAPRPAPSHPGGHL